MEQKRKKKENKKANLPAQALANNDDRPSEFIRYSHIIESFAIKPLDQNDISTSSILHPTLEIIKSSGALPVKINAVEQLLNLFLEQEPKITLNDKETENKRELFQTLRTRSQDVKEVSYVVDAITSLILSINQNTREIQSTRKHNLKVDLFEKNLEDLCTEGLTNLANDLIVKEGYMEQVLKNILTYTMFTQELCTIAPSHETHFKIFTKENFFGFKEGKDQFAEPSRFITANLLYKQFYRDVLEESLTAKNYIFKLYKDTVNEAIKEKDIELIINKIINNGFHPKENKGKIDEYIRPSVKKNLESKFKECGGYKGFFKDDNKYLFLIFMPESIKEKFSEIYKEDLQYDSEGNLEEGYEYIQTISDVIMGLSEEKIFAKNYKYNINPKELDLLTDSLICKLYKGTDKEQEEGNKDAIEEKDKIFQEATKYIKDKTFSKEETNTLSKFYNLARKGDRRISDALIGMASCNTAIADNFYKDLSQWSKEELLDILEYYIEDNIKHKSVLDSIMKVFVCGEYYSNYSRIKAKEDKKENAETLKALKGQIESSTKNSIKYLQESHILKKFLKKSNGSYLPKIINLLDTTKCGHDLILNSFGGTDNIVFKALEEEADNEQKKLILSNLTDSIRLMMQKPKLALMNELKDASSKDGKTIFHYYEDYGKFGPLSGYDSKLFKNCHDALSRRDNNGNIAFYNIWAFLYYNKSYGHGLSEDYCDWDKILKITDSNKNNILHKIMSGETNELITDTDDNGNPIIDKLSYLEKAPPQTILESLQEKNNQSLTPLALALKNSNFYHLDRILTIIKSSNTNHQTQHALEIFQSCLPWFSEKINELKSPNQELNHFSTIEATISTNNNLYSFIKIFLNELLDENLSSEVNIKDDIIEFIGREISSKEKITSNKKKLILGALKILTDEEMLELLATTELSTSITYSGLQASPKRITADAVIKNLGNDFLVDILCQLKQPENILNFMKTHLTNHYYSEQNATHEKIISDLLLLCKKKLSNNIFSLLFSSDSGKQLLSFLNNGEKKAILNTIFKKILNKEEGRIIALEILNRNQETCNNHDGNTLGNYNSNFCPQPLHKYYNIDQGLNEALAPWHDANKDFTAGRSPVYQYQDNNGYIGSPLHNQDGGNNNYVSSPVPDYQNNFEYNNSYIANEIETNNALQLQNLGQLSRKMVNYYENIAENSHDGEGFDIYCDLESARKRQKHDYPNTFVTSPNYSVLNKQNRYL
jgi:hypothetical protein